MDSDEAFSSGSPQEITRGFNVSFVTCGQVYAPDPYGDYVAPPPHAPQIIYTADGQLYPGAYPYHYQGGDEHITYLSTGEWPKL